MAIAAIEPVKADMMLMAERNGLDVDDLLSGDIRRSGDCITTTDQKRRRNREREQHESGRPYLRRDGIAAPQLRPTPPFRRGGASTRHRREVTQRGRRLFLTMVCARRE